MRVGGIVLCGGRSSRMGRPKAWLPFGDELLLPRIVRILGEVVSPVVVVAAAGQDLPPLPPGVAVAFDEFPERGPLQGLLAGLQHLEGRADVAYVSACDAPLLRAAFVRGVIESLGMADAAVPDVEGQLHPLAAAYRVGSGLRAVRAAADRGRFAVRDLFVSLATNRLGRDALARFDPGLESLRTANTPAEFAQLLPSGGPSEP
ncbi:molybdenum cofactor guanylyltransferase [Limnoglobus roseus]|uniref:Molybdenum cofactor guanylyltransferase n=1 Tax=Limnoglobus roseus TaxID=2598579 RepID=A0A5C1ALW0_9BACT|nr:molybdenum cofactor guanylyltransferase [Limnoglobus roseus]QEL20399.1 molybdenum cofactor guanylyltransferase [Limnoglobus roseus]